MSANRFRAWTGNEMVYNIGVDTDGVALRPLGDLESETRSFLREPTWNVMRWTGFFDGAERPIFCHDVLGIGDQTDKETAAPVLFRAGRFVVLVPWILSEENERALALYCQSAYVHSIAVIGYVFETRWTARFGELPIEAHWSGRRSKKSE